MKKRPRLIQDKKCKPTHFYSERSKILDEAALLDKATLKEPDPAVILKYLEQLFSDGKNPEAAISAFLVTHRTKAPIPNWVTDWLAEAFEKYESSEGTMKLENLLGFRALRGKGKRTGYRETAIWFRNYILIQMVLKLCSLGIKPKEAFVAVAKQHNDEETEVKGLKVPIRWTYLRKICYQYLKDHPLDFDLMTHKVSEFTVDEKNRILRTYNLYPLLKTYLKK